MARTPFDVQDLRDRVDYERRTLAMVVATMDWDRGLRANTITVVHVDLDALDRGADTSYVELGFPEEGRFRGGSFGSPAAVVQAFTPLIVSCAHKLFDMFMEWVLDGLGRHARRTYQEKAQVYRTQVLPDASRLPPVLMHYRDLHRSVYERWVAFTPIRNSQIHRGGVRLDSRGTLLVEVKDGDPLTVVGPADVRSFVMMVQAFVEAVLLDPALPRCHQQAHLAAAAAARLRPSGLGEPPPLPRIWWASGSLIADIDQSSKIRVDCARLRLAAQRLRPPEAGELVRYALEVETRRGTEACARVVPAEMVAKADYVVMDGSSGTILEVG